LKDTRTNIANVPLFTVRTSWTTEKIRCLPYPENDARRLDVSWDNVKGRAEKIIVRLWRLPDKQFILVQDQVVDQGNRKVEFKLKNVEFPSGSYLVHLMPYDPWSTNDALPRINAPNSQLIEISWEIPKDIVTLQSVYVEVHPTRL
jgi:hypothetical protein